MTLTSRDSGALPAVGLSWGAVVALWVSAISAWSFVSLSVPSPPVVSASSSPELSDSDGTLTCDECPLLFFCFLLVLVFCVFFFC